MPGLLIIYEDHTKLDGKEGSASIRFLRLGQTPEGTFNSFLVVGGGVSSPD